MRDPAVLASSLQKELKRVGCDPGSLDGTWGPKAKQALAEFARVTKLSFPLDQPSDGALEVVSQQKGKICTTSCKAGETEVNGKCTPSAKQETTRSAAKNREAGAQKASKESGEGSSGGGMCWLNSGPARLVQCGAGDNGRKVFKD